jgi:hypothetical protein
MNVDSYLELFTTMFGWTFYDAMWDILTGTGLAYIPFVWLVLSNLLESHNNGMDASTPPATASLKRLEIELGTMLFVVVLAAQPSLTMDLSQLKYGAITAATNPTTFGSVGFVPASTTSTACPGTPSAYACVPIWWSGVMSVSAGINSAAMGSMPNVDKFRDFAQLARMTSIDDPLIAEEARQFFTDCFVPARSKYYAEQPMNATIAAALVTYGKDDTEWMGSHVYQATYYVDLRASRPVTGFAYDPVRDTEYAGWAVPPTYGRPYCVEWWASGSATNLQTKINSAAGSLIAAMGGMASMVGYNATKATDGITRITLNNVPPGIVDDKYLQVSGGSMNQLLGNFAIASQRVGGLAGSFFADMIENVVLFMAKQGLPMLQAFILMGIYLLLPFALVLSSYKAEFVVLGTLGIFTIKFWTFLWAVATWIDQNMIAALYPSSDNFMVMVINAASSVQDALSGKKIMLDLVTTSMFFVLPAIWTFMMGWASFNAMSGVTNLKQNLMRSIQGGASGAVAMGKSAGM